jgi:aspartate/methionine/tyrosine aminotransferase
MTGLRLGYCIAPRRYIRPMQNMQQNFFISANSIIQIAGITALHCAQNDVERMKRTYNTRRRYMIDRLRELGFGLTVEPTGAFYVFVNARHHCADSYAFALELLEHARVGVAPGIDFGGNGEGYIRFSYANSLENITEGLQRIGRYLENRSSVR